jgi:phosphoribosylglycinamide formyltransferase-1
VPSTRLVVLASGTGSILASLLAAGGDLEVVAVGADRPAPALAIAEAAGIPGFQLPPGAYPDRPSWDGALADAVEAHRPDFVVCAGFMRLLGPDFLERFAPHVVNTHPALLPAFPGAHPVRDALAYAVKVTGATVHLVDAGVDSGPVVAQECVPVWPGDDEATLHERIKQVERRLLVETLRRLAAGFRLEGRMVIFDEPPR